MVPTLLLTVVVTVCNVIGGLLMGNVADSFPCHGMSSDQVVGAHDGSVTTLNGERAIELQGADDGFHGYYYLTITAGCFKSAGTPVTLTLTITLVALKGSPLDRDGFYWGVEQHIEYDHNPVNPVREFEAVVGSATTVRLDAVAGTKYRIRISNNTGGTISYDHATLTDQ